jgi:chemotaxis protein histidine kinase CheA
MDAVKTAVDNLKGTVEVESAPDKGTKFKLRLPLTLAVIKALLFEVGGKIYAIPISAISEVTRIMMHDLTTIDGRDTLRLRDQIISIIRLQELFGLDENHKEKKFALILNTGEKKLGFLVDRIEGQQELVIKAVEDRYTESGFVTGASILGNGRVVLILDTFSIFRKAIDEEKKQGFGAHEEDDPPDTVCRPGDSGGGHGNGRPVRPEEARQVKARCYNPGHQHAEHGRYRNPPADNRVLRNPHDYRQFSCAKGCRADLSGP